MSNSNLGVYPVKFRDLVNELAKLFEMDYKKDMIGFYVTTSVCYYGRYNLEELIKLMNDKDFNFRYGNDYLHVTMYGKKGSKYVFFYNFKLKLNYDEIQADGRLLKDYMKVNFGGEYNNYLNYSSIGIDDNIDNLVLYFDDDVLSKEEKTDFFPRDLLNNAVNNCLKRLYKRKIR